MKIKLVKDWMPYRRGLVLDHPRGAAKVLIDRGIAEEVKDAKPVRKRAKQRPKR